MFEAVYNPIDSRLDAFAWLVRIILIAPLAVVYLVVHLTRRASLWYNTTRAESWPLADALINSSYEVDENQSALSRNTWFDQDDRYRPRSAVALEYSYRVNQKLYGGSYFLPHTFTKDDLAIRAEHSWAGRKIRVRYNPAKPAQSIFLVQDGAPGKPHIPRMISYRLYMTELSLK